ncbi:endodeoxyribonuclease RusA [Actinobacteria bacterium OV450]|nr:endodeoxyribonuclease RusA [Actinobacteria bacterium OV450]
MSATVVRVLAVSRGQQLDCGDEDTAHVWVRVAAWSPRRAFLTGASPFADAAAVPAEELAGRQFIADLDLDAVPSNDDTTGERLEWPGLTVAPKIPEQWGVGAAGPDGPAVRSGGRLLPVGGPERDQERALLLAEAIAPGCKDRKVIVLAGPPPVKARHRVTKEGRTYQSQKDADAEQRTGFMLRRSFPRPWTGNLAIGAVFFRPDRQRVDVDNLIKHVCDAGNGVAWSDDQQITAVYGTVELDADHPRTVLVVARHLSTLDRSDSGPRRAPRRKGGGRS